MRISLSLEASQLVLLSPFERLLDSWEQDYEINRCMSAWGRLLPVDSLSPDRQLPVSSDDVCVFGRV